MLVEVSSRRFVIPFECPCCGAAPDGELAIALTRIPAREIAKDTAHSMLFPYCTRCIAHVSRWEASGVGSAAVLLVGLVAGTGLAIGVHVLAGAAALVAAIPLAALARKARRDAAKKALRESCAGPGRAVAYLGWSGATTAVDLESHAYAAKFAEANTQLVASPRASLTKLLEGHRLARLAVPSTVAATVPAPASVREWITRLEATASTVERRAMLSRALDALTESGERQLVIQATTRLEVAPLAAELDGLNPTVKIQRLQRAIDDIRADNIPEALQAAVLFDLEGQLRALRPKP